MQPLLFDEGLPGGTRIPAALATLGLEAHGVGDGTAPPSGSSDEENCKWCAERGAVLVTQDRGKSDRVILDVLDRHKVGAIVVLKDLRMGKPHELARALLTAEGKMDQIANGKKRLRHYLRAGGGLAPLRR